MGLEICHDHLVLKFAFNWKLSCVLIGLYKPVSPTSVFVAYNCLLRMCAYIYAEENTTRII